MMTTRKKIDMSQRLTNGQGKLGLVSKSPLFSNTPVQEEQGISDINKEVNVVKKEESKSETITATPVKANVPKKVSKDKNNEISFKSYVNNSFKLNSSNDEQDIKYEIDVVVLRAVNSIQTDYNRDSNGNTIMIKYFEDKDNSKLFKTVIQKVTKLVNSLDITVDEKEDYFSRVIDDFIRQRFTYIIKTGLDEMFSPKDIEHALKTFIDSGKEYFDETLLDDYLNYYFDLSKELIYSRVDRNTFYVNELLNEVLNIIRKDTKADVSILFNELVLKNVDRKYIELAKKNIYERKPFNNQFTKYQKKTLKQHNLI